jgi:hypothetical protein
MATKRFGLKALRKQGSGVNGTGYSKFPIANGYAADLYNGDPVKVSAGFLQAATNTDSPVGVFRGCRYVDSNTGKTVWSQKFPANTSSGGVIEGANTPLADVEADVNNTYVIVADATVTAGMMGLNFKVSAGTADEIYKSSGVALHVSSATTSVDGLMLKMLDRVNQPGNEYGVDNMLVEVRLLNHINYAKD